VISVIIALGILSAVLLTLLLLSVQRRPRL
jgi:hypothetical protein